MKKWAFVILPFLVCCKSKKNQAEENGSFPVLSFIQSQVAHVDSSLYSIMKIETVDSTHDTSYIRREDFRKAANDFLSLPDIASKKWKDDYVESRQFDQDLGLVVLEYTPKDDKAEIRREQVYIQPGNGEEDKVERIIIDKVFREGNTVIHKNMLWKVDSHFQVATSTEKPGSAEQIKTVRVTWKDYATSK
jgi:hypothetical protein